VEKSRETIPFSQARPCTNFRDRQGIHVRCSGIMSRAVNRILDVHAIDCEPTPPLTSVPQRRVVSSHTTPFRNTHRTPFSPSLLQKGGKMSLRKRLLAVVAMIQLSTVTSGSPNLTAISLQSPNLNTSPFRLYDDRPDDCPPWFVSAKRPLRIVSTVFFQHSSVRIMPPVTNTTANVNVPLASEATTVSLQVLPPCSFSKK
jgi:hypothetical protein